jgi:L-iditol 2-dehydrogenase
MKAVYAEAPGVIGLRDIPIPRVDPDGVLIRVEYTGICGSDLHAYRGTHAFRKPPVMLGHEVSGIVTELGNQVRDISLGDAVTVVPQLGCGHCDQCRKGKANLCGAKTLPGTPKWNGTFAEYFAAPAPTICALGDMPLHLGALAEPLAVAVHVLKRIPEDHPDRLLILGSGTIGLMILIIAPAFGFGSIMVTDIKDQNLGHALRLGAKYAVNALKENVVSRVREAFGRGGVENVIIAAGGPNILEQAIQAACPGGLIDYFAMITQDMTLNTYPIVFKELVVTGSLNYTREDFTAAIAFLREKSGPLGSLVTHMLPLSEAEKGFSILTDGKENAIKILLRNP